MSLKYQPVKEVSMDRLYKNIKAVKLKCQRGQSTLEYAMVTVIAIVISAILIAVGKPHITEIISNVFEKISGMV